MDSLPQPFQIPFPLHKRVLPSFPRGTWTWLTMIAEPKFQFSADSKEIHLCWKHIRQSVFGQHFGGPHGDQRRPKALGMVNKQVEYLQIEPIELTDFSC